MAYERTELRMRARNMTLLAGTGTAVLGAMVAAGRYAMVTAQDARDSLSIAGWGPENQVPLRVGFVKGRPRFTAGVLVDDVTVKLAYRPQSGTWTPVSGATHSGTPITLSESTLTAVITSRKDLEELMHEYQPVL